MEDYREAQKKKWQEQQAAKASASVAAPAQPAASETAASSASPVSDAEASPQGEFSSGDDLGVRRIHVLPLAGVNLEGRAVLETLTPKLRSLRSSKATVQTGQVMHVDGKDFVVIMCDPEKGHLTSDTDYYCDGDPVIKFEKVQFSCLWDFESRNPRDVDPEVLFSEYIAPYFKSLSDARKDMANIVCIGDNLQIRGHNFQVMAAEPEHCQIGIIDFHTTVYVDWDSTPEFEKIHIVPFQDTLPSVPSQSYTYDVFGDYLKPYLTKNKHMRFSVNDLFTFQGVQFKVVCCEPTGPARIGRNSTIYCEGVLHPSLRTLLPPELLEQLSHLPPGLQMLLLNTDALAGGYDMERLMEVQDMLNHRRGLSEETIQRVEQFRWGDAGHQEVQTQCMVCLCDFEQGEEVRKLPCAHVFHAGCVDEWLRRCTDCPICKANVDRAVRQY